MSVRTRMQVIVEDITLLDTDAIVNAANAQLLGGGGVDGAIHRAAGPQLLEACRSIQEINPGVRCPTGMARMTPGFNLRARYVIHTVGPVYSGGLRSEPELLASCYTQCMTLADQYGIASIAFPCISTGVYGYPIDQAAKVAVHTVEKYLIEHVSPPLVLFCCFSELDAEHYRKLLACEQDADFPLPA